MNAVAMKVLLVFYLFIELSFGSPLTAQNSTEVQKLQFNVDELVSKDSQEKFKNEVDKIGPKTTSIIDIEFNDLADEFLNELSQMMIRSGIDPLQLNDEELSLPITGSISLSSGWLQDISTIHRFDEVIISYSTTTKEIGLTLPIKFDQLLFTYKYVTRILLLSISGDVHGKINDVKLNIKVSYDPQYKKLSLDQITMSDTGRVQVYFTGNGLVDWITNAMTTVVTTVLHPIIIRILEGFVRSAGRDIVDAVNAYIADK